MAQKHTVLAVLDWGLGHASRCIPLARQLLATDERLTLASSGHALALLRKGLPEANFLQLPSYGIRYPSSSMVWNMSWQGSRIARVIWQERRMLNRYLQEQPADRIISDGRFGCYLAGTENIWLAHQLQIQHPNVLLAKLLNSAYHHYVRRHFQAVWVPDEEGPEGLAGQLADPIQGISHRYLGPLSRFSTNSTTSTQKSKYDYLALLSGPEPQRTYLENELRVVLQQIGQSALLVRGVPGSTTVRSTNTGLEEVDWLYGEELQQVVSQSAKLICRSGYSTLMDLHFWQKPALLIPTPGQTEQQYLAQYWAAKGWAEWQQQGEVKL